MNSRIWREVRAGVACLAVLVAGVYSAPAWSQEQQLDESAALGVLQSDAGFAEKQAAFRALRQKGTAASVPVVAGFLTDPELSHMARYALEEMPYPEAGQALRDALGKVEGRVKAGIATTLGVRQDAEAVPLLAPLLKDGDADVAKAAAGALGRIGTAPAAEALQAFAGEAPESLRGAVGEALLAAGERAVELGEAPRAASLYENLLEAHWPEYVRMGAFAGLAQAQPEQAPDRLLKALAGDDAIYRNMAADIVAESDASGATSLYTEALPGLPAEGQAALLRGLAGRGDAGARPAVVQAVQSPDKNVKLAAVRALSVLGTAEDVRALTELMAAEDREVADTAKASLTALKGDEIDAALASAAAEAAGSAKAQLLTLLAARASDHAAPLAVKSLEDSDPAVRVAALDVLGPMGKPDIVPAVLQVLLKTEDSAERSAAEKALTDISARSQGEPLPTLMDAMKDAATERRTALLRVIARSGGPKALETVLATLNDADPEVAGEAMSLLSNWPTTDAAPHLLVIAEGDNANRKILGLRGYIRLAERVESGEEKANMLKKAMELAERPEEKRMVLSAWGSMRSPQALEALLPHLDDPAVQDEAAVAIISVAGRLMGNEAAKAKAVEALNAVVAKSEDAGIRERAQKAIP